MEKKEEVVAIVQQQKIEGEAELTKEVTGIEFQAESLVVKDEDAYKKAGEFGRVLKQKASDVVEFFKPMKDSAYKAHKEICEREKQMITPLKNAEKILKNSMGAYAMEVERKRKEEEDRLKKIVEMEAERKLEEAIKLEENGDNKAAEDLMVDAEITDQISKSVVLNAKNPTAEGVSLTTDWEIVEVDNKIVPLEIAGIAIRPVDMSAVMKLIRASKGTIQIPGISYKPIAKMSFRR
ncbi:hypothetical protein SDC9_116503 [bioreactor metagenome]|uniref:Uncharacterized protein n=1 Tax=bioreactor metagenome TaxID=1076179 RepID=A0A645BVN2_9ZZZZ